METWHFNFGSIGGALLFEGDARRLEAARALVRVIGAALLVFCIVDTHLHVVAIGDRRSVAILAGHLRLALRSLGCPQLQSTHFKRVDGTHHLRNLVEYVLCQPQHHGLVAHPAEWEASSFADLVGARHDLDPDAWDRLTRRLPRYRRTDVWAVVGLAPLQPLPAEVAAAWPPPRIEQAAASAYGESVPLRGRRVPVVAARQLAVHLLRRGGRTSAAIAELLGTSLRTVQAYLREGVSPEADRAARLRLAITRALTRR